MKDEYPRVSVDSIARAKNYRPRAGQCDADERDGRKDGCSNIGLAQVR